MNDIKKIVILAVLVCLDLWLLRSGAPGFRREKPASGQREGTMIIPYLYLEQLDPFNLSRCHRRFELTQDQLLSTGMSITRAGERGDIPLDCVFQETMTVGQEHAVVAMDEYGCFIQNSHINGMSLLEGSGLVQISEAEIEEGTIVYLGQQPIRFRYPQIRKASRPAPGKKLFVVLQTLIGSLTGFAGKNRASSAAQRPEEEDW